MKQRRSPFSRAKLTGRQGLRGSVRPTPNLSGPFAGRRSRAVTNCCKEAFGRPYGSRHPNQAAEDAGTARSAGHETCLDWRLRATRGVDRDIGLLPLVSAFPDRLNRSGNFAAGSHGRTECASSPVRGFQLLGVETLSSQPFPFLPMTASRSRQFLSSRWLGPVGCRTARARCTAGVSGSFP